MEYYKIAFYDHNKDFVGYEKVAVESFLKARIQAYNLLNSSIYPTAAMATVFDNDVTYDNMAYAYYNK